MTKILGLELAPLNVPFSRRLQTLAVMHYVFVFLFWPIISIFMYFYILYTKWWFISVLYSFWFFLDVEKPKLGSRRVEWFRRLIIWRYLAEYFPICLEKTADLDPSRNYLFGYHPHGIASIGAFTNFSTEGTGFGKLFPGISVRVSTLVGQFWYPFRREYVMLSGSIDCSKESFRYIYSLPQKGQAVALVIGGAEEALDAHPNSFSLVLNRRKGFVKLALQCGVDLVPVYSFGENDLFDQVENPPGSLLRRIQSLFRKYIGFSPPVFHGRGVFNYTWGFLPYRKPITTIVGKPIPVEKSPEPTSEQVDELHKKYCEALLELFETHKEKFGIASDSHLHLL